MATGGLKLASVMKSYPTGFRLGPLDMEVGPGITVLVGPNGAGKSTLMGLCTTLLDPESGDILVNGISTRSRAGRTAARAKVGYLPQEFRLPRRATPSQFLHYVAWLRRVPSARRQARVDQVLSSVGLTGRRDERIARLSGGMKRRLGIAYALVHDPEVIILDEPTVGLDPQQRLQARKVLRTIAEECAILVSTHLVEDVQALADRVVVLDEGQVRFHGSPQSLIREGDGSGDASDSPMEKALSRMWTAEK
ncbi:ATP-binding cassette domain-containing protein [Micromonospora chalcea]|uniref:ATP-binding cassette domain-containing protein n=2 Tax=Micromonospora chalcea TaxID=1874 RepID=UPI000A030B07|nr:ATP-binding cassette domain-containing protein [Micromonospora purpureochromogenes]